MRIFLENNIFMIKRIIGKAAAILLAAALFCCSETAVLAQDYLQTKEIYLQQGETGTQNEKEELQLYAGSAVLMDADSGRVLYGKNEKDILPMASTTKIMTCILALEYGNPEEIVEVSSYAASMPKVKLYVKQGERYRLEDLLYSLMLESHNDSAVVIAEAVGGSVEGFASMMNQKARDIGCFDSYFITPNGLDAVVNDTGKIHSTTAADLAKIMAYCVTDSPARDKFLEITQTIGYDFTDADGQRSFHCNNHNAFLGMMNEAISGKTGVPTNAGYWYVGAIESEGRTFTVALLACGWPNNRNYKWSDMKKLTAYGMDNYQYRDIYEEQETHVIQVRNGIDNESEAPYREACVTAFVDDRGEKSIPYLLCGEDEIEEIGTVCYYLNGELIKRYPIVTKESVDERTYGFICNYLLKVFLL